MTTPRATGEGDMPVIRNTRERQATQETFIHEIKRGDEGITLTIAMPNGTAALSDRDSAFIRRMQARFRAYGEELLREYNAEQYAQDIVAHHTAPREEA